jgi:hypothetical protein
MRQELTNTYLMDSLNEGLTNDAIAEASNHRLEKVDARVEELLATGWLPRHWTPTEPVATVEVEPTLDLVESLESTTKTRRKKSGPRKVAIKKRMSRIERIYQIKPYHEADWSPKQIGKELHLSEGYVKNLISLGYKRGILTRRDGEPTVPVTWRCWFVSLVARLLRCDAVQLCGQGN